MTLDNLYFIDGADMWQTFGIGVEEGSDGFLKIPERKPSISHDWGDEDGLDIDLSRTFFKARDINLKCFSRSANREDFFVSFNKLISVFRKPGPRRLTISRHRKDYFVYYKDNNTFESFNFLDLPSGAIMAKFTLTLSEPKPTMDTTQTFITDEAGRFLIT